MGTSCQMLPTAFGEMQGQFQAGEGRCSQSSTSPSQPDTAEPDGHQYAERFPVLSVSPSNNLGAQILKGTSVYIITVYNLNKNNN